MSEIEELYAQVRQELYDLKSKVHRVLDSIMHDTGDGPILKNLILDICDVNSSWDASFAECKVDCDLTPLLKTYNI